ncbi:MAG TPA: hypothetical protein VG890_16545 [Puia sp.]|nr:hypothetical protein [Puia sp.]
MKKYFNLKSLLLTMVPFTCFSQVTITGPTCVTAGMVYQYNITGSWDSTSTMSVCVTGGSIADTSIKGGCTPQSAPLGAVQVIWNAGSGSIALTSSKGNASINVQLADALQPGSLDAGIQMIDSGAVPATIHCSLPSGGYCSPSYSYQWQRSYNAVAWEDISGKTGQNLDFSTGPDQSTYYRRKTTETESGSIAYSQPALVGLNFKNN